MITSAMLDMKQAFMQRMDQQADTIKHPTHQHFQKLRNNNDHYTQEVLRSASWEYL